MEETVLFMIAVIMHRCAGLTTVALRDREVLVTLLTVNRSLTSWEECITTANCTKIVREGVPVDHPRKIRYFDTSGSSWLQLGIKKASMTDGGRYIARVDNSRNVYVLNLVIIGNTSCNASKPHRAKPGETVTYKCVTDYQGLISQPLAQWDAGKQTFKSTKRRVFAAQLHSCYIGVASWFATQTMTEKLHGTKTNFTFRVSVSGRPFAYQTGQLKLIGEYNNNLEQLWNKTIVPLAAVAGYLKPVMPYLSVLAIPLLVALIITTVIGCRCNRREGPRR